MGSEEAIERLTFSVSEVAKVLGISKNAAYLGIKRGEIPSIRIGARILVPKKSVERILAGGEPAATT